MPRHGSGRPLHLSQLGSTPHDRVTSPQIRSSHSLPLDRPRQDASRHPPVVTNRPTTYRVRRDPPLIQQPIQHPPACWSASTPFTHFIRGTQIPIAQDATPTSPSRGFLPWRFAYAGPPVHAAPPSRGRHPQTFTFASFVHSAIYFRSALNFGHFAALRQLTRWAKGLNRSRGKACCGRHGQWDSAVGRPVLR